MNEAMDTEIRVPADVLASRPFGVEVAARMADLVEALNRAAGEPPAQQDTDPEVAAEADLVDEIGCWERAKARCDARQIKAMAALAASPLFAGCAEHGDDDPTHGVRGAASIVSAELCISPGWARSRVELACELVTELPAVVEVMAAGRIDAYKTRVIVDETRPLAEHAELRRCVVDRLLGKAERKTGGQLRAAARKAVLAADPAGAKDRHERARRKREVRPPCPEPDGLAAAPAAGRGRARVLDRSRRRRPARQDQQPRRPAHPGADPRGHRGRPGLVRAIRRAPRLLQPGVRPHVPSPRRTPRQAGARRGHRAVLDCVRDGRAAGRSAGLRPDHRRRGPQAGRGWGVAAAAHRPGQRSAARLRPHALHPTGGLGRVRGDAGSNVQVPDVHLAG